MLVLVILAGRDGSTAAQRAIRGDMHATRRRARAPLPCNARARTLSHHITSRPDWARRARGRQRCPKHSILICPSPGL
jgi:hypothetical protein